MRLADFNNDNFDRGRSRLIEAAWRVIEGLLFNSWLPGSAWRVWLLVRFGATVGRGVVIKPHVRVKFPWRLRIGDHSWIGESVWIDNLAEVRIGSDCCISQGAYLCTGSHRWNKQTFDLETRPIRIEDQCWVGAMACVGPGVTIGEGAVLTMGSTATLSLEPGWVSGGAPALALKPRRTKRKQGKL
jgi:putative colanic acid biosynthesis acetyltransferase WcaF